MFLCFLPCTFGKVSAAVRAHAPLISAVLPQQAKRPLQPSAVNPLLLSHILAFPLQRDVPPLQPLSSCAHPSPISLSLKERGEPPLLPSTVRAYVPLLSALHLRQGVPLFQPSVEPAPLPHILALPFQ